MSLTGVDIALPNRGTGFNGSRYSIKIAERFPSASEDFFTTRGSKRDRGHPLMI